MTDQARLHPERIRRLLQILSQAEPRSENDPGGMDRVLTAAECETCHAALELVRKTQLAFGLTANVVDAGTAAKSVLEMMRKLTGSRDDD